MTGKWLREPLLHFVVLGALVFGLHALFASEDGDVISVTAAEQERLAELWTGEAGRVPTDKELDGAVAAYVEEEALYREAIKLGLDEGDTIIRRRLAQKLRFTIEDRNEPAEPSDSELEEFFAANADNFAAAATISFSHIFLSPDADSTPVETRAAAALAKVGAGQEWRGFGDPFILQRSYGSIGQNQLGRLFGPEFAKAAFAVKPADGWQGPVASAYGLHLVRVEAVQAGQSPKLDDVRADVVAAWQQADQRTANQAAIRKVVDQYQIKVEPRQVEPRQ